MATTLVETPIWPAAAWWMFAGKIKRPGRIKHTSNYVGYFFEVDCDCALVHAHITIVNCDSDVQNNANFVPDARRVATFASLVDIVRVRCTYHSRPPNTL